RHRAGAAEPLAAQRAALSGAAGAVLPAGAGRHSLARAAAPGGPGAAGPLRRLRPADSPDHSRAYRAADLYATLPAAAGGARRRDDFRFWILDFGLAMEAKKHGEGESNTTPNLQPPTPNPRSKIQNAKSKIARAGGIGLGANPGG